MALPILIRMSRLLVAFGRREDASRNLGLSFSATGLKLEYSVAGSDAQQVLDLAFGSEEQPGISGDMWHQLLLAFDGFQRELR